MRGIGFWLELKGRRTGASSYHVLGVSRQQPFSCLSFNVGFCLVRRSTQIYQQLPDLGYTHSCVNHTLYFKDPVTGVHTNRQEGLWKHIRTGVSGSRTLEDSFVDFMMRQHFTTGEKVRGRDMTVIFFNGYLTILKA